MCGGSQDRGSVNCGDLFAAEQAPSFRWLGNIQADGIEILEPEWDDPSLNEQPQS